MGTAGWSIPRGFADRCGGTGTHLERFSRVFSGVEINSSFYRPHAVATYARWAQTTPPSFRFAVKLPRAITHERELRRSREPLERFLAETTGLGDRRGPILIQLPPGLAFDLRAAGRFFDCLRSRYLGQAVCEPRHPSWFTPAAERLLHSRQIGRVAADPARATGGDTPGGWPGIRYYRLHGSPHVYWSRYSEDRLAALAETLRSTPEGVAAWVVFDNTAAGAAIENAWELQTALDPGNPAREARPASGDLVER